MADVLPFKRPSPKDRHKGKSLCREGHHKWLVDKTRRFDVKRGKLITVYRCSRCGRERVGTE